MMALSLFVFLALLVTTSHSAPAEDLITNLPGLLFKPNFKQYSGYLNASGTNRLHYWFVESDTNPERDPVVLWMNGGPGCSSINGLLAENGPFRVKADGEHLEQNAYAWNKQANVIFLEAPAGVGYSYTKDPHFATDDDKTARDNHLALSYFFKQFPEYSNNEFYITGESYSGIYIPTLVSLLLDDPSFKNLKGFAVGNGLSDINKNDISRVYFMQFHNMLSSRSWKQLLVACDCGNVPLGGFCNFYNQSSDECKNILSKSRNSGVSDPYNVYADCEGGLQKENQRVPLSRYEGKNGYEIQPLDYTIGCADTGAMTKYMNMKDTRQALHIPNDLPDWDLCANIPYTWLYETMKPQYVKAIKSKRLRILVYNGDIDSVCNFLGDEWFVDDLNLDNPSYRRPWFFERGSISVNGGFVKSFQSSNLNFVTVRGAGHMVPYDKPAAALAMISKFLQNKHF